MTAQWIRLRVLVCGAFATALTLMSPSMAAAGGGGGCGPDYWCSAFCDSSACSTSNGGCPYQNSSVYCNDADCTGDWDWNDNLIICNYAQS